MSLGQVRPVQVAISIMSRTPRAGLSVVPARRRRGVPAGPRTMSCERVRQHADQRVGDAVGGLVDALQVEPALPAGSPQVHPVVAADGDLVEADRARPGRAPARASAGRSRCRAAPGRSAAARPCPVRRSMQRRARPRRRRSRAPTTSVMASTCSRCGPGHPLPVQHRGTARPGTAARGRRSWSAASRRAPAPASGSGAVVELVDEGRVEQLVDELAGLVVLQADRAHHHGELAVRQVLVRAP